MSNDPVKMFAFVGVAALIGAGVLSQNFDPAPPQPASQGRAAAAQPPAKSWWSSMFGGMEFRSQPVNAPQTQRPQQASVQAADPAPHAASGFGAVTIKADQSGQYHADIEIDSLRIPMMVDTGATVIALRYEDADRLGIHPSPSEFTVNVSTANGEIKAARVKLRDVRLENITVTDVQALVLPPGVLSKSLLGMSFMNRLSSFQIANRELVLKP